MRLVHRIVHKALADAVDDDLLAANPASKAKVPRRQQPETSVWSAEQAAEFLRAQAGTGCT